MCQHYLTNQRQYKTTHLPQRRLSLKQHPWALVDEGGDAGLGKIQYFARLHDVAQATSCHATIISFPATPYAGSTTVSMGLSCFKPTPCEAMKQVYSTQLATTFGGQ